MSKERKLIEWLLGDDTGTSSKAVAAWLGVGQRLRSFPSDGGDFGRCWRLLELMEWFDRVPELAEINGHWAVIVEYWSELSAAWQGGDRSKVYSILKRIEPDGYEREGFDVSRNPHGGLSSATKKGAFVSDLGGIQIRTGF
ncbi:hypothetical protein UFOVP5_31 [uncultured Caudovirales phage]|uniref:Uncharacterized protein n=1 Tax=uncultured Caudovirales phage TaxID=2100421 RepID=A0A6J5KFU7_9CAUD|nr:hypothetical protein UFOVP5_31 [uncultured Caudovirales phage]